MGMTAENIAEQYGVSREDQDRYSVESQRRAGQAIANGWFKEEIVPVEIPQKRGDPKIFDTDEHPRAETTYEDVAKLKPAFKKDGTVTAGNASGINDAAARYGRDLPGIRREARYQADGADRGVRLRRSRPQNHGDGPLLRHDEDDREVGHQPRRHRHLRSRTRPSRPRRSRSPGCSSWICPK